MLRRSHVRQSYSHTPPLARWAQEVLQHIGFSAAELDAEPLSPAEMRAYVDSEPRAAAPEPVAKCQILYLKPRAR